MEVTHSADCDASGKGGESPGGAELCAHDRSGGRLLRRMQFGRHLVGAIRWEGDCADGLSMTVRRDAFFAHQCRGSNCQGCSDDRGSGASTPPKKGRSSHTSATPRIDATGPSISSTLTPVGVFRASLKMIFRDLILDPPRENGAIQSLGTSTPQNTRCRNMHNLAARVQSRLRNSTTVSL